jgi:hypothetical protein
MSVRSQSSSPPADSVRVAAAAALGIAVFSLAWALIHGGPYDDAAIVDTPVYQGYGDKVVAGEVPYRDFELEYPPGALPIFVLPSLGDDGSYVALFESLMLACGAAAVAFVAAALAAAGVGGTSLLARTAPPRPPPFLLGPVVLSRFDLWPAALTVGALAALAAGRDRLGLGVLGGAVAAKLYPVVLLPLALLYVWRRRGRREAVAAFGVFALVLGLVFGPFLLVAPDGVVASLERQTGRPLQLESLGASLLLAADRVGLYGATVVSSHGSQNLGGALPDALASAQTVLQGLALLTVWVVFARSRRRILIWLVPLVPLVLARTRLAGALFAGALATTLLWFPYRYWDVVALEPIAWAVLARDALLVALFAVLLAATARGREAARTT